MVRRPFKGSRIGERRPSSGSLHGDVPQEDALRAALVRNPNDIEAFDALARIVRRRTAEAGSHDDPLAAPADPSEVRRAADLAVWSLGEEFAGHPKAWFPLIELARLSIHDDHEGALRRLQTAIDRDASGVALVQGLAVLRDAGLPAEALGLGVAHWRPLEQGADVGRLLVLAALEADRPLEAKQHLATTLSNSSPAEAQRLRGELEPLVSAAHQHIAGT